MARLYDPNDRTGDKKIPPDRVAWVHVDWLDVIQSRAPSTGTMPETREEAEDEEAMKELGKDVKIIFMTKRARPFIINLPEFTVAELDAMKELIDNAFEEARDECLTRDAKAQEAYENGDDSLNRLYRPVPKVIYRQRKKHPHGPGIHGGPPGDDGVGRGDKEHD